MHHRSLGNTGLSASIAALGCGGPSRLGLRTGHDEAHAASIVDLAISLGVNTIDTAESYGTESAVGRAIKTHDRSKLVIATKKSIKRPGPFHAVANQPQDNTEDAWRKRHDARPFLAPALLRKGLEQSLQRLGTDYIDIYFLHAPLPHEIDHAIDALVPEMDKLRDEGKLRFTAVSEMFAADTSHQMLGRVRERAAFDVAMVGFNMLNQSARETVFAPTTAPERTTPEAPEGEGMGGAGVMNMFTVRKALQSPPKMLEYLEKHAPTAGPGAHAGGAGETVRAITEHPSFTTLPDVAYRFAAHEPGVHTVLTGTGNPEHLRQNIASITAPPLDPDLHALIVRSFAGLDTMSGN